jgi:hypothetical protein
MFISHKSNVLQQVHEVEWQCRRKSKGLSKPEYWTWLETVTSGDPPVADFSGEDYEIVETEVDVSSFNQSGHIHSEIGTGQHYHLKWDGSKVVADDDALAECQLAEQWKNIRLKRSRLLAETDYLAMKDQPDMTNDMQIYRKKLRDLPQDNSDVENITWPTKPS